MIDISGKKTLKRKLATNTLVILYKFAVVHYDFKFLLFYRNTDMTCKKRRRINHTTKCSKLVERV